ncbi:uncharacterized protein LOC143277146 isoform X2 [Babylonia areolata]|uniref:uncharacterized protein LOC143277146 isoform X2 n=1 Tax=Babylonia areolata TaxID=304850 RepID=UPI003FD1D861
MSHVHEGPLATYNSLTDGHLAGYFANSRMRRHLQKAGLVSRRGEIVSEATYRLNMSRREHKKHVKDMLAQAIVHKTLDMERSRQSEIKKKLEEIAKIQLVRRVRASTSRKGDEDVLPLLTPRSSQGSPSPASRGRGQRSKQRPHSHVPGARRRGSRMSEMSQEEDGDVLYLDDEGRPITPAFSDRRTPDHGGNIDSRHLHSLDTVALRKYALMLQQMEEGRGVASPYMMPQVPLPPRPPSSARTPRSVRRVQSASPRRTITTDSRLARLHRPETAKSHAGDQQTLCRVAMRYHGWALNLARERTDLTQEVVVEQQHCGGNTLTVFKERLEPGSKFEFISYRHRGFPFSLSLYVDGQMDSRVSTCCEYRHSRGAKIGGRQGHFSLLRVTGAVACYKCQVVKGTRVPNRASPKRLKRPPEVRREEVVVVETTSGRRSRQQRQDEDEEEDVEDGAHDRSVPVEDDYDDDFEDSQASAVSKTSSASESESDSETERSTLKEEAKKDKKQKKKEKEEEEEFFHRTEDRGRERDDEEEEGEGASTPRGGEQERQLSARSPRVEVNGTGRQIDDYSSDEEEEEKNKVVSVEDEDADADAADNTPIRSHRRSSASSASSSMTEQSSGKSPRRGEDPAIISVDRLDREEKQEEEARKDRARRHDLRRKEEHALLQRQQSEREERKKAEEARRQEDALRQQRRDEERRQRDEQRRQEAEKERRRREEEEEKRHAEAQAEQDDPEAREQKRTVAQKLRDEQIREEQRRREETRRKEEEEREARWKEQESQREVKRRAEAEERAIRRQEEGSSSARSETSTGRSTAEPSSAEPSSAESTPRRAPAPAPQLTVQEEADPPRPSSPFPTAAVYEPRPRRLREPQEDSAPPRASSPLPPAAVYEDRRRERRREREPSPARAVSPLPAPATYEARKKSRRAEEEAKQEEEEKEAHVAKSSAAHAVPTINLEAVSSEAEDKGEQPLTGRSSTTDVTNTVTSDDSDRDDGDLTSQASLESVHEASQGRAERVPDSQWISSPQYSDDEELRGLHAKQADDGGDTNDQKKRQLLYSEDAASDDNSAPVRKAAAGQGRSEAESGTADSSPDSDTSSDDDNDDNTTTSDNNGDYNTSVYSAETKDVDSSTAAVAVVAAAAAAAATTRQHQESVGAEDKGPAPSATSDSDGENMHGGADPDNVAEQEDGGELLPLRTQEVPTARAHPGEIMDLVSEDKDSVELSNVLLNKSQVYQLASHLEKSGSVRTVSLCNTGLDDDDLQRLTEAVSASPSEPVMLNLSLNSVSQKGVQHVLRALKAKPSIKLLILQGNPIGDEGAKELTLGLQQLHRQARANRKAAAMETTSDTLSVDSGSSSFSIGPSTSSSMAHRYLLQDLDLTDTGIGDAGASDIARLLIAGNVYVEHVNLSHNPRVTAEVGWKQVGEALPRNRCLRSLTLDGNRRLGDDGVGHVARGLQANRGVRSLALEDCGIGTPGGKALVDMLKRNTAILELTLSPGNALPRDLAEDIAKYVTLNRGPAHRWS